MAHILTNADRELVHEQFDQMFRARAAVFHHRLNWNVSLRDEWEIDRYDDEEDPVYLVTTSQTGSLTGSLRLLPTMGPTLLGNEFAHFFDEPLSFKSPTTWECTRFCIHPVSDDLQRQVASELLISLCELALKCGVERIVGLYDEHMPRVYRRIGWSPSPLAVSNPNFGRLTIGVWGVSVGALNAMKRRINGNIRTNRQVATSRTICYPAKTNAINVQGDVD